MGGEDDGRGAQVQVAGEPQAKGGEAVQVPVTGGGAAAEGTDAHRLSMRPRPTSATRRPRSGSEVAEAVRTAESVGDSHRDGRATARSRRRGLGCSRTATQAVRKDRLAQRGVVFGKGKTMKRWHGLRRPQPSHDFPCLRQLALPRSGL